LAVRCECRRFSAWLELSQSTSMWVHQSTSSRFCTLDFKNDALFYSLEQPINNLIPRALILSTTRLNVFILKPRCHTNYKEGINEVFVPPQGLSLFHGTNTLFTRKWRRYRHIYGGCFRSNSTASSRSNGTLQIILLIESLNRPVSSTTSFYIGLLCIFTRLTRLNRTWMKHQTIPKTQTRIPTPPRAASSETPSQQMAGSVDQRQHNFAGVSLERSTIVLESRR
jgi:hypothetical protein